MQNFRRPIRAYWKLPNRLQLTKDQIVPLLRSKGCTVNKSANKPELLHHFEHADLSRPCYYSCSQWQLVKFIVDRGLLNKEEAEQLTQASLAQKLIEADCDFGPSEVRSGTKTKDFMDLPAEMRVRIYEYYIEGFSSYVTHLSRPPLARSCKTVMREFMPVFYDRATFCLSFADYFMAGIANDVFVRAVDRTNRFIETMRAAATNEIILRKVVLQVDTYYFPCKGEMATARLTMDSKKGKVGYRLNVRGDASAAATKYRKQLDRKLRAILAEITKGTGKKGFIVDDLVRFGEAVANCRLRRE